MRKEINSLSKALLPDCWVFLATNFGNEQASLSNTQDSGPPFSSPWGGPSLVITISTVYSRYSEYTEYNVKTMDSLYSVYSVYNVETLYSV